MSPNADAGVDEEHGPEFETPSTLHDIPGWFWWADQTLFSLFLQHQAEAAPGTVVELGTYLGKSAVLIGRYLRPSERFVVCDLFGGFDSLREDTAGEANRAESEKSYGDLTRRQFEHNYLTFHPRLPEIVEGPSATIRDVVQPDEARFVHIDASHVYEMVRDDIAAARDLLRPSGMVVIDDYRSEHTPGVAAAAWEAILQDGLVPVALTATKMYAVFDAPDQYRQVLDEWLEDAPRFASEEVIVAGHSIVRVAPADKLAPPDYPITNTRIEELTKQVADCARALDKQAELTSELAGSVVRLADRVDELAAAQEDFGSELESASEKLDRAGRAVWSQIRREVRTAVSTPASARRVVRDLSPPALTRFVRRRRRTS